jgi:multidrug transporter EmrE-like cation transporter
MRTGIPAAAPWVLLLCATAVSRMASATPHLSCQESDPWWVCVLVPVLLFMLFAVGFAIDHPLGALALFVGIGVMAGCMHVVLSKQRAEREARKQEE